MKFKALLAATIASLLTAGAIALAQQPGIPSTFQVVWTMVWEASSTKPTYSASANGITPVASGTDICTLSGSATRTVRVRRIIFGATAATPSTEPIAIVKRSTANTGSGTAIAKVARDSQSAASTVALAEVWTANPTPGGTLTGVIADVPMQLLGATTRNPATTFAFGDAGGSALVLRGIAQSVSLNASGITLTGTLGCTFEWTEETP